LHSAREASVRGALASRPSRICGRPDQREGVGKERRAACCPFFAGDAGAPNQEVNGHANQENPALPAIAPGRLSGYLAAAGGAAVGGVLDPGAGVAILYSPRSSSHAAVSLTITTWYSPPPVMPSYFPVPPVNSKTPRRSGSFASFSVYLAKTLEPSFSVKVLYPMRVAPSV
jgi:hypothetical protein